MDFATFFQYLFIAFVFISVGVLFAVSYYLKNRKRFSSADLKKIHTAWRKIESYARGDGDRVFTEGDKLIDHCLKGMGYQGSMAEKMKSARKLFGSDYEDMWWLHKKRNSIAHEVGFEVNARESDRALRILRRILKRFKAL